MPFAAKSPCLEPHCPALVSGGGRCPAHRRQREQVRGSAHARGYTTAWQAFRLRFAQMLLDADILPICGAVLPDGPQSDDSHCRASGRMTAINLELDHEPPLTEQEREQARMGDRSAFDDPTRVQFLCADCHKRKTQRQGVA